MYYNDNYIEYESNSNKNKIISIEEYLNKIRSHKIRSYLKNMVDLKEGRSVIWKIHLMIVINFQR